MYKKITVLKNKTDDVTDLNDRVRSEISDFLQANGWTLTDKGNSYNIVLKKDYSPQDATRVLNTKVGNHGSAVSVNYENTLLSISRHSTNGRVISILCGENPKTRTVYTSPSTNSKTWGVGYDDTYDSYGQYGVNSTDADSGAYSAQNAIRIDDLTESLQVEMFYFVDDDLQEEFYFVFRNNRLFGRESSVNSEFYQTVGFLKIPGVNMLCTSTLRDSPGLCGMARISPITALVVGENTGVKYIKTWSYAYESGIYSDNKGMLTCCNMATTPNTTNPRFDAPDSEPNIWLHLASFRCLNPFSSGTMDSIATAPGEFKYANGLWFTFNVCFYKATNNNVDAWASTAGYRFFESYAFLGTQGCSSELGGTVLVPIRKLFAKGETCEVRHAYRYNMYHTKPESTILSDAYKCYPTLRRSLMGYSNYTRSAIPDRRFFKNPSNTSDKKDVIALDFGVFGNQEHATRGWWFTEEYVDGMSQPVLKSSWIGEEIDASGYEGFALDYSDYDANNVSVIDLTV